MRVKGYNFISETGGFQEDYGWCDGGEREKTNGDSRRKARLTPRGRHAILAHIWSANHVL